MIKSYLKIAWRNLVKHPVFSVINLLGLSIGIAACWLIYLYIHFELTYDQYNAKADRIARITFTIHTPESDNMVLATTPVLLAEALRKSYPEAEATVRIKPVQAVVKSNGLLLKESRFYQADQSIFSIFTFSFVQGTAIGALQAPNCMVLTQSMAKKYFGNTPALGKTLICNGQNWKITGVIADRPANSDIPMDALMSVDFSSVTTWMGNEPSQYTFVLFRERQDLRLFEHKLNLLLVKNIQPEFDAMGAKAYHPGFELEWLKDVHFSQGKQDDTPKEDKHVNYIFLILAVFILLIAVLNYINLSTAKATERAKEVGIRKVIGAGRRALIRQFLFESFLLIILAVVVAFGVTISALPLVNKMVHTHLSLTWSGSILFLIAVFLFTVLPAGLYPAFVLSGYQPVEVLKGTRKYGNKGSLLRKIITVTQFVITATLVTGTIVIYAQMKYVSHKDLGFNKNKVVVLATPVDSSQRGAVTTFIQRLAREPDIAGITAGSEMQMDGISIGTTFAGTGEKKREMMCNYFFIDPDFLPVMQIPLSAGRNISDSISSDKNAGFLVNEAFVAKMGWKSPIGQAMEGFNHKGTIVGVVRNFYYKSLHNVIEPLVLVYNNKTQAISTVLIKIQPRDLPKTAIIWKQYFAHLPFEYAFMDDAFDAKYRKDKITMHLFNCFTLLAIIISCLGLYGLVMLLSIQRRKEIGVRKVMGATLKQLVSLLITDFMRLILLASLIALPLAAVVMNKWLSSYAYHTQLTWWMFALTVLLMLMIALSVTGYQVVRTALANPVKSLRTE